MEEWYGGCLVMAAFVQLQCCQSLLINAEGCVNDTGTQHVIN